MKKTIYTATIAIALMVGNVCKAQTTFEYVYDNAGNRTERNVLELKSVTIDTTNNSNNNVPPNNTGKKNKNIGTDILGDMTLNLYPNPTVGKIELEINNYVDESTGEILVFDIKGALLFRQNKIAQKTDIDLSDQPQGTYIVKIVINGEVSEWKIMKE